MSLGNILLYAGLPAIILFTLLYGLNSKWYKYPEGRALMAKSTALALIGVLIAISLFLGPAYEYREVVRLLVYGFFFFSC